MKGKGYLLIDVRSPEEFATGHLEGAINLPYGSIAQDIQDYVGQARETKLVLYCRSGRRSGLAEQSLRELGFTQVRDIGGLDEAKERLKQEEEAAA
ncbi:hypothetical protein LTS18_008727 [Coniosporium uncinatum]|uniref:Uncharacterized protein n=1 Tax=Coniosporium uncinatum TaxID=93489 RepID=A0ACC3DNA9_9PEZI|nr:hypothetical protein LTS18_008727 [Coniosporium uncinatum]